MGHCATGIGGTVLTLHSKLMTHGQVGDLPKPGTSPEVPTRPDYNLQPVTGDTLASASEWVKSWPEARGHTNLVAALSLCRSRWDEIGVHGG